MHWYLELIRTTKNCNSKKPTEYCPLQSIKSLFGEHPEMVKAILGPYVSDGWHTLKFFSSKASDHLKRTCTAAKYYHHQVFL